MTPSWQCGKAERGKTADRGASSNRCRSYPVLIDGDTVKPALRRAGRAAASFYVDRNGTVVAAQVGVTTKDEMEADIRKALGEQVRASAVLVNQTA